MLQCMLLQLAQLWKDFAASLAFYRPTTIDVLRSFDKRLEFLSTFGTWIQ